MSNIMLLGGGTQGLALVRELKKKGNRIILFRSNHNYADSSRYVDVNVPCKYSPTEQEYLSEVKQCVSTYNVETIIPMGDVAAGFLSLHKKDLLSLVKYKMPDYDVFVRATDKNQLMKLCKEKGYPHPFTIDSDTDINQLDKTSIPFPLLIKPNITCGARGMTLVNSYEELCEKLPAIKAEYGECHLQQYIKQGGAQVEVQLYVNENRQLVNSSVIYKYRWYPEKGGSSCCAKSIKNDIIVDILYHLLLDLNWVGFADFDTIEDPDTGELLIMELNPRVPACVKCAIEAGMHWGEIILNGYMDKPQKQYEYKENEYLRHLGFETLWFLKSPNRFKTKPFWFKLLGKHIHYQDMSDWSDPMPFIVGSWNNLTKVLNHKEKEKVQNISVN